MTGREKRAKSTGVTFRLNEPGMGEHERVGLAGLSLSLTAATAWEKQRQRWPLPKPVEKSLDRLRETISNLKAPDFPFVEDGLGACLEWSEGNEKAALEAVVKWAWQVHDGVLFLPGVHRKREHLDCYHLRTHVHNGIFSTFWGKPNVPYSKYVGQRVSQAIRFDDESGASFTVSHSPITLVDGVPYYKNIPSSIAQGKQAKLPPWSHPGAAPRFNNNHPPRIKCDTDEWLGTAKFAYLMRFAPIACHYIKLPRAKEKIKAGGGAPKETMTEQWGYMIPSVGNLRKYQREFLRRNMVNLSNWPFYGEVAGLEDAILRFAVRRESWREALTIVMGNAGYFSSQSNQKTRKNLLRSNDQTGAKMFLRYQIFNRVFPVGKTVPRRGVKPEESDEKGNHRIELPNCRERITANILRGDPWYANLAYIPFWQRDRVGNDCQTVRERGLSAVRLNLPWKKAGEDKESISPERLWFLKLHYFERIQLMSIANESDLWDDPQEKDMLDAFREAFRRLLDREDKALRRGGSRDLPKRWDNTADKWHRRLLHAKTKLLLSTVVHELLAQAARSHRLKNDNWEPGGPAFLLSKTSKDESDESRRARNNCFQAKFRRMMNHPSDWKKVRDLALLALTTFTDSRLGSGKSN